MIPRLALLGAAKHWRRSLVVVGAVAVACAVMIAVGSLLNGITGSFYDSVIPNSGHVRIDDARTPSAVNPFGLDLLVGDSAGKIGKIRALGDSRIAAVEGVLTFGALLVEDSGEGEPRNLPMRGIGLEEGSRFADTVRGAMVEGSFLPGGSGIALSRAAARLTGSRLGGGVLVLVQDRGGQPWYERLVVTGVFHTESADFDETTFYMGAAKAAQMLDTADSSREIRVLLVDRNGASAVAAEIAAVLSGGEGPALRVLPWQVINASVTSILLFVSVLLGVIMALFAVVAGTIIANSSLMSIMERLREFGTMRAIGLRARSLERLVLLEGAILGAVGAAIGIALGSLVVALLSGGGVDLGGLMETLGMRRYNRPRPDLLWYAACAAASLAVSLAATARAARSVRSRSVADSLATAA